MKIFFSKIVPQRGFSDKLSEFSIFLAWPAILDIYSHGLLSDLLGFLIPVFLPCKLQLENGRKGAEGVQKAGENNNNNNSSNNNNNNNNNNNRIFTKDDRSVPSTVINGVWITKN